MARFLIAYYSWTGTTAKVAQALASRLGAGLEAIAEVRPRLGSGGHVRSVFEAVFKMAPAIAPSSKKAADYDVVILGSPVWAQDIASPMRSYIRRERNGIRQLALFCTQMGAGGQAVVRQMAALAKRPSIGDLVLLDEDVKSQGLNERLDLFARQIRAEGREAQAPRAMTIVS
jgi:flavodoxin